MASDMPFGIGDVPKNPKMLTGTFVKNSAKNRSDTKYSHIAPWTDDCGQNGFSLRSDPNAKNQSRCAFALPRNHSSISLHPEETQKCPAYRPKELKNVLGIRTNVFEAGKNTENSAHAVITSVINFWTRNHWRLWVSISSIWIPTQLDI